MDIEKNKEEFLQVLRSIQRPGAALKELEYELSKSDFFKAPATTKYNYSYEGGLCQYCLDMYYTLDNLNRVMHTKFDEDSIKIVGLFSGLYKMNYYKEAYANVKEYREDGTKRDNLGSFEWVSQKGYKVRDAEERYIYGTNGQNSERIISQFIPLKDMESAAIIWHKGFTDNNTMELSEIYNRYHLALLTYNAHLLTIYLKK